MEKKLRILSVIGTRPEAVKMAPVIQELNKHPEIETINCVTAQHREMLDQVLNLFDIKPDIDLNLMKPNQSLAQVTALIFDKLDPIIKEAKPDWILAQGDTTTVMVTSLLAYYNQIKFGHVEAGLRTWDNYAPFPEEVNRKIAGIVANCHFAPTNQSRDNLLRENIDPNNIIVTGNTVIDALMQVSNLPCPSDIQTLLERIGNKKIILVTAHRRENFGKPLENITNALLTLTEKYKENIHIIYPVHLNPNVQTVVYAKLGNDPNITLLPPLDYLPMVHILKNAYLVLTDSGGLQEEAPGFGKPVLVLRSVTERPEGIEAGTVKLAGTEVNAIISLTSELIDDPIAYEKMAHATNPYGDGFAAKRIVDFLTR